MSLGATEIKRLIARDEQDMGVRNARLQKPGVGSFIKINDPRSQGAAPFTEKS